MAKAELFLNTYGLKYVVDMDLSKCFDRLDHELILKAVAERVSDGSVLKLIRQFLKAGVMKDGAVEATEMGSPQGGVISPLLANIYLDRFDQAMMARDIRMVRYADDILVFARSPRQARRFEAMATRMLEEDLKLVVNKEKTHRTSVQAGVHFLGMVIYPRHTVIDPKRVKRFKERVRTLTARSHGGNLRECIGVLNRFLRGWIGYFRVANCKGLVRDLMQWIRRRLRMMQMQEWKSWQALHRALRRRGHRGDFKKLSMRCWRNSASPLLSMALPNAWFGEVGLLDLTRFEVGVLEGFRAPRDLPKVTQEPCTRSVRTVL